MDMNKPVVILVRNAAPQDFGGGERFPVFLAEGIRSAYRPIIISRSKKLLSFAGLRKVEHVMGWWWTKQNWSGPRALLWPVYFLWQLVLAVWYVQLFIRLKPSVVHLQSRDDFIAGTLAGKLVGARVVWTDHADLKHVFKNVGVWYKNPVGKLVYACSNLAAAISVVSRSEELLVTNNLSGGSSLRPKIRVIYNGIADHTVVAAPREAHPAIIFCTTSRLVRDKGIAELLEAFAQFHKAHPDSGLWLIGDGPERHVFEKGQAGVTFMGHVDEPLPYVKAADVFVHPTYHEGFSVSLVEASMLERPIIATSVGGNKEIIFDDESGLLVTVRDSSALLLAMEKLAGDSKLRSRLAHAARKQFEEKFEFNEIIKTKFLPLYEKDIN